MPKPVTNVDDGNVRGEPDEHARYARDRTGRYSTDQAGIEGAGVPMGEATFGAEALIAARRDFHRPMSRSSVRAYPHPPRIIHLESWVSTAISHTLSDALGIYTQCILVMSAQPNRP